MLNKRFDLMPRAWWEIFVSPEGGGGGVLMGHGRKSFRSFDGWLSYINGGI